MTTQWEWPTLDDRTSGPSLIQKLNTKLRALRGALDGKQDDLGWVNVKRFGAQGDGITDDTAAIQRAIGFCVTRKRGTLFFPSGKYLVTATLTCPTGLLVTGAGSPGSLSGSDQTFSALLHGFDGDLLVFDGTTSTGAGTGCGVRDIALYQQYGSSGGATVGRALVFVTTDDNIRPNWCRVQNVNIEQLSLAAPWEWGLVFDGTANSNLLRDCWVESTRIAVGGGATGGLNCLGVANLWAVGMECNLTDADFVVSGDSTHKSSNIHLLGCSVAGTLNIDYAQNVFVDGGSYNTITVSANAGGSGVPVVLKPGQVTNAVTNNAGSNCLVMRYDVSTGLLLDKKVRVDGTLGVQSPPSTTTGVLVDSTATMTGSTSGFSVKADGTMASDVTNTGAAVFARVRTEAASFTQASAVGVSVQDAVKGAGSTITTQYGLKIESQTQGGTNYALYTGTGRARFGDNVSVRGVDYTWPSANASGVLTNNGSGTLSWAASGGSGGGGMNALQAAGF